MGSESFVRGTRVRRVFIDNPSANPVPISVQPYAGTEVDEQVAVANATAVQIPTAGNLPAVDYRLTFSVDQASTGLWEWRRTSATTFGHRFSGGQTIAIAMAASEALFVFHDQGSSQDINVTIEPVS